MKKVCFTAEKGGVGKTTLSVNIAAILANRGKKVVLVDTDEQCNATLDCGVDIYDIMRIKNCAELFGPEPGDVLGSIIKEPIPQLPTLDLIPSTFNLMIVERNLTIGANIKNYDQYGNQLPSVLPEALILRNNINKLEDVFKDYDYMIFDTKPSLSQVNENVFACIDSMICVTDCSYNGMIGLVSLISFWKRVSESLGIEMPESEALVLNKYRSGSKIKDEIYGILKGDNMDNLQPFARDMFKNYNELFVGPAIKDTVQFVERSAAATPLVVETEYKEKATLAQLEELVDNLINYGAL